MQTEILKHLQSLKGLREAWRIRHPNAAWQVPVAPTLSQGPDNMRPPFDAATYFTDIFRAYEYCIFQMTLILLFLLYQDLSAGNVQPVQDILPGLSPNGSMQQLVGNICRCTEFLCLDKHGSRGYIIFQLPATIAYLAVGDDSLEAKWLHDACKKRARSSGFGWGEFAMDQVTPLSMWMTSARDRRRNQRSNSNIAEVTPCWPRDSEEGAMVSTSV